MSEKSDPKPEQGPSPIGEISQEPSALEAFLDANQKRLLIIGILAVLCLVGYVIVTGLQTKAKRDAAADVAAGRTVPEYDALSKTYEGDVAGGTALLLKSQLLWSDQQQQEAITAIEDFISKYPEHPAFGDAHTTLGSYLKDTEKLEEAKAAFEKAAETKSATSSIALLSLGDLALQAGNGDQAKEYYDRVITEFGTTHLQAKGLAQERIKLIGVNPPVERMPEPPKPTGPAGATTPPAGFPGNIPSSVQPAPLKPTTFPVAPTPGLPVAPPAIEPTETSETVPTEEVEKTTSDVTESVVPEEPSQPAEPETPSE